MTTYEDAQKLTVLDVDEQTGASTTLAAFRAGKPLVLDFWHTRCTRCPAAISKLDDLAPKHPHVQFASCALSLGSETEGTQEQVLELLEGQWENLAHLYMTFEEKEFAKKEFGFTAVPFAVVFNAEGKVCYSGDPAKIDVSTVFDSTGEKLASDLEAKACVKEEAPATKPLAEANRAQPVALGFGNDDEDF